MNIKTINTFTCIAFISVIMSSDYFKCHEIGYNIGNDYHSPCFYKIFNEYGHNSYRYRDHDHSPRYRKEDHFDRSRDHDYSDIYYGYCVRETRCCEREFFGGARRVVLSVPQLPSGNCTDDWYCCSHRISCQDCIPGNRFVNGSCIDINECEETYGLCSGHQCINTNGSYTCECYDSYQMIGNLKTCQPINQTKSADLLFSATSTLNLVSLNSKNNSNQSETSLNVFSDMLAPLEHIMSIAKIPERNQIKMLYSGTNSPKSIDYSFNGNYIVWTDELLHQINIAPLNNNNPSLVHDRIILKNLNNPICTTIDWIHNLVYWIDIELLTINVINIYKPDNYYILVNITNQEPKDIVVNVFDSVLYWNHIGLNPKILRSSQDGSNQTVLYSTFKQVFCMTIDNYIKRIYFIDIETATLYSINFDGMDERSLISSEIKLHSINSMSIYYDDIYLSSHDLIFSINKFGHNQTDKHSSFFQIQGKAIVKTINSILSPRNLEYINTIISARKEIFGLKIIDPSLQPMKENKCQYSECSHLCLPVNAINVSFRCICPENYALIDERVCTKNKSETIVIEYQNWENDLQKLIDHSINKLSEIKNLLNQSFTEQIDLRNLFHNALNESNKMKKLIDIGIDKFQEIKKSYILSLNDSLHLEEVLGATLDLGKLSNQTKLVNGTNGNKRIQSISNFNINPEMSIDSETVAKSEIIVVLLAIIMIGLLAIIFIALFFIGVKYDWISFRSRSSRQSHINPVYGCNPDSQCLEESKF